MTKHTVTVLQDDIDNGQPSSAGCPVARAARRDLGFSDLLVFRGTISYGYSGAGASCHLVSLPDEAAEFVRAYDKSRPVSPFKFEIELD